jgi:hypothetical protein
VRCFGVAAHRGLPTWDVPYTGCASPFCHAVSEPFLSPGGRGSILFGTQFVGKAFGPFPPPVSSPARGEDLEQAGDFALFPCTWRLCSSAARGIGAKCSGGWPRWSPLPLLTRGGMPPPISFPPAGEGRDGGGNGCSIATPTLPHQGGGERWEARLRDIPPPVSSPSGRGTG